MKVFINYARENEHFSIKLYELINPPPQITIKSQSIHFLLSS